MYLPGRSPSMEKKLIRLKGKPKLRRTNKLLSRHFGVNGEKVRTDVAILQSSLVVIDTGFGRYM